MAKYKITRVYMVEAETKAAALERVKQNATEYLEYESATIVAERKESFGRYVVRQVTGK